MSGVFGQLTSFPQEGGSDVSLHVFGDEFYARYETESGYTCVYDPNVDRYCYAMLDGGRFVSTGVTIDKAPLPGLRRHLKEAPTTRNEQFGARFANMQAPTMTPEGAPILETYGPNQGLLTGRQLTRGRVQGLTILVNFQDVQTTITQAEVHALLNGEQYTANGNYCSVREYYRLMSSGLLDYTNVVVGPLTLSREREYYAQNLLAVEALELAAASGVDFSQFDSRGEGIIDAVSFMYAGPAIYRGELWPHNWNLDWSRDGYQTNTYQITGLGRRSSDLAIGTFCHESGHMLCRFPDLYDYGERDGDFERSAGLGAYCLMSAGNHQDNGHTPAPICAYYRYLAGWQASKVPLTPGAYEAKHGDYGTALIFETVRPGEFFLVENRSGLTLDAPTAARGLAVYHCDIQGSNEWATGTLERHYQCALLQADARFDLEHNTNQGDAADFFAGVAGEVLTDGTVPNTRLWDGSDSGLYIGDVDPAGEVIGFRVF